MSTLKIIATGARDFLDEHVAVKGVLGITGTLGGAGISLTQLEQFMRMGSLAIGMTVGVLTIRSIVRKNSK